MNLANASQIVGRFTDTAIFSPGTTYFTDKTSTIIGSLETPDIPSQVAFFQEIANFSKILNLFDEPNIQIEGTKIRIAEGDSHAYFLSSDASLVMANIDIKEQMAKSLEAEKVLTIDIEEALINKLKNTANCIPNSSLIVKSKDGKVSLTVKDVSILSSESHSYSTDITSKVEKVNMDFEIEMDPTITSRMPKGPFRLEVAYSTRKGTFRAIFRQGPLNIAMATNVIR